MKGYTFNDIPNPVEGHNCIEEEGERASLQDSCLQSCVLVSNAMFGCEVTSAQRVIQGPLDGDQTHVTLRPEGGS